jgi:hypothetical protein
LKIALASKPPAIPVATPSGRKSSAPAFVTGESPTPSSYEYPTEDSRGGDGDAEHDALPHDIGLEPSDLPSPFPNHGNGFASTIPTKHSDLAELVLGSPLHICLGRERCHGRGELIAGLLDVMLELGGAVAA